VERHGGLIGVHTQTSNMMGYNYDVRHDYDCEKFIEVISHHGIGEYPGNPYELGGANGLIMGRHLQDILERGFRYGTAGSTDSHYTYHRHHLSAPQHPNLTGYMGVLAAELSREAIFEALRNRRVFATSGPRFSIDFRVNGHMMGEEFTAQPGEDQVKIEARVESLSPIERVEVVKNARTIESWEGSGLTMTRSLSDRLEEGREFNYYYLRVTTEDDHFAWSSPVWVDW